MTKTYAVVVLRGLSHPLSVPVLEVPLVDVVNSFI